MSNFESPITNRKFAAQPLRELEVPDESEVSHSSQTRFSNQYDGPVAQEEINKFQQRMQDPEIDTAQIEREVRQGREDKLRGQTQLTSGAKHRIEMLIGMTRLTRTVEIEDNKYVLQTLKGKEMRHAIAAAAAFDGTTDSPFEIRRQLLARSLTQIAGIPIEQFIGSSSLQDRLIFIEEMDDILLNRLMDEYSALVKDGKKKYAMETLEQVQEVAEDLKK